MPPNRKAHIELSEGIAFLQEFLTTSKFPTLTEQTEANVEAADQTKTPDGSLSYWDWSSDPVLETIQQEEKVRILFSADHITANLVAASKQLKLDDAPLKCNDADSDNYWYMLSSKVKHDIVQNDLLSADHIESNLEQDSHVRSRETPVINEENQAYWEWPAWKQKEKSLQLLQREQRELHLLSLDHIEKMLLEQSCHATAPAAQPNANNDEYWAF